MGKDIYGNFIACIYSTENSTVHMPAIIFASINADNKTEVDSEYVCFEYITNDARDAHRKAKQDLKEINEATFAIGEVDKRANQFLRMMKEREYFPTPESYQGVLEQHYRQSLH